MKIFIAVAVLILLACSPENPMEPTVEPVMAYVPVPVVQMFIMNGDTIYDANQ